MTKGGSRQMRSAVIPVMPDKQTGSFSFVHSIDIITSHSTKWPRPLVGDFMSPFGHQEGAAESAF
jgi:hypothetical protein